MRERQGRNSWRHRLQARTLLQVLVGPAKANAEPEKGHGGRRAWPVKPSRRCAGGPSHYGQRCWGGYRVNPNTGTAPILRIRRDAALTTAIYDRLPVLVDRSAKRLLHEFGDGGRKGMNK
jgi:hypothetical protein